MWIWVGFIHSFLSWQQFFSSTWKEVRYASASRLQMPELGVELLLLSSFLTTVGRDLTHSIFLIRGDLKSHWHLDSRRFLVCNKQAGGRGHWTMALVFSQKSQPLNPRRFLVFSKQGEEGWHMGALNCGLAGILAVRSQGSPYLITIPHHHHHRHHQKGNTS